MHEYLSTLQIIIIQFNNPSGNFFMNHIRAVSNAGIERNTDSYFIIRAPYFIIADEVRIDLLGFHLNLNTNWCQFNPKRLIHSIIDWFTAVLWPH